ncbi:MAG: Fur family transcriptional regulator [Niameybacter sp.]|uniref:Fur family transcriptional regulator n=1 Tax=Niameybacter sp. TaxID=2033640 RepID=UPI002FC8EE25
MLITTGQLREHHLKVTPQRLAIFHMLSHTTSHPSAEMIYNSLRETHPTMSLATVYKTLDALVKATLVQQINVGEDAFRYDANTNSHPHIICTKCHCVCDLDTYALPDLKALVAEKTKFTLSHEQLYFYGTCPDCQSELH